MPPPVVGKKPNGKSQDDSCGGYDLNRCAEPCFSYDAILLQFGGGMESRPRFRHFDWFDRRVSVKRWLFLEREVYFQVGISSPQVCSTHPWMAFVPGVGCVDNG